ncbi:hypothetical protein HDU97_010397 [Phlyctochytrium planicorne]|nr:hypothetical protein HDU97_010397 [Phlyctochytrium planicorne]
MADSGGGVGTNPILIVAPTILGVLLVVGVAAFLFVRGGKGGRREEKGVEVGGGVRRVVACKAPAEMMAPAVPIVQSGGGAPVRDGEKSRFFVEGNLFANPHHHHLQPHQNAFAGHVASSLSDTKNMNAHQHVSLPFSRQTVSMPFKSRFEEVRYEGSDGDVKVMFESNVRSFGSGKADYVPNAGAGSSSSGGSLGGGSSSMVHPRRTTSRDHAVGIAGWSPEKVAEALRGAGINSECVKMLRDLRVDGHELMQLDHERLHGMGLEPFDARVVLLMTIGLIKERNDVDRPPEYS